MASQSFHSQPWKFFRRGGLDQVALENAYDLWALRTLDQKLWVALACPVAGLELDEKTLALIDTDGDGRIRVQELIAAVEWAAGRLKDPGDLLKGEEALSLASIDDSTPAGKALVTSARKILSGLGRRNAAAIMVPEAADPRGLGTDATKEAAVLGDNTAAGVKALQAVRAKVDDFFTRCRLIAFDDRAAGSLNRAEADFGALAAKDLKLTAPEVAGFPIAHADANYPLPLIDGLNPAWKDKVETLRATVVVPLLGDGKTSLTEEEWGRLNASLAAYETWLDGRTVSDLERLTRFHRDLRALLHNFVNFADFYSQDRDPIFKAGTLYLDGRSLELCVRVGGASPLAATSRLCIAYCQCTRAGSDPMTIAACFTQGDSDFLIAGRHGVFYDRGGQDWDAMITSLVSNPISIREAILAPYKKLVRVIEDQVAKRAATAAALADPSQAVAGVPTAPKTIDVGTVAALGVAFGAIGTFLTALVAHLTSIVHGGMLMILGAFAGVLIVISGPSVLIAWLKLRERTLGPLLDANGWAVNGRVAITVPLGEALTSMASLPPGSERTLQDPYEDKRAASRRKLLYALALIVALAAVAWNLRELWMSALQKLLS